LALAFGPMVRDKDGSRLDAWLEAAATSGLAPFTRSPFDIQAVCDAWKADPSAFKINPHHLIPGPHT
jgi:hypothetical protein